MPRVNLTTNDQRVVELRTKEYCDDMFGEDFIAEAGFGIEVPQDVVDRYQALMTEFRAIQTELKSYQEQQDKGEV